MMWPTRILGSHCRVFPFLHACPTRVLRDRSQRCNILLRRCGATAQFENFKRSIIITHGLNCSSQTTTSNNSCDKGSSNDWITIYRFPYILQARMVCRMKLYQTFCTVLFIPISTYFWYQDMMTYSGWLSCLGVASFACCALYAMGQFFRRLIGIMYISQDLKFMKVSHLTFWGHRRDIIVPVTDVIPFTDFEINPKDVYLQFRRYSTNEVLYFVIMFGGVVKPEEFTHIMGEIL